MADIEGERMSVLFCSNLKADNLASLFTVESTSTHLVWKRAVVLLNK